MISKCVLWLFVYHSQDYVLQLFDERVKALGYSDTNTSDSHLNRLVIIHKSFIQLVNRPVTFSQTSWFLSFI